MLEIRAPSGVMRTGNDMDDAARRRHDDAYNSKPLPHPQPIFRRTTSRITVNIFVNFTEARSNQNQFKSIDVSEYSTVIYFHNRHTHTHSHTHTNRLDSTRLDSNASRCDTTTRHDTTHIMDSMTWNHSFTY
jgi:hypothetical protein